MSGARRIGDYIIIRPLGAGGMGQVYEAEEVLSKRRVALKVLRDELATSEDGRTKFIKEMGILAGLDSPHIVRCLHCTEADGQLLIALEYLDGETLRARLNRAGPMPWPDVVAIAGQVASALQVAHQQNPSIIHRDLKPENIMLVAGGHVKLLDFGIAKIVGSGQTTHTVGTLQYMSPEHIDARVLDGRADLFSLGLVMWEMLAGRVPFASDSPRELLDMLCTKPTPPLPQLTPPVPVALENLIRQLLQKSPHERPSSATDVLGHLTSFLPNERQPAAAATSKHIDTIGVITTHERKTQSGRQMAMALTTVVLVAVGVSTMWLFSDKSRPGDNGQHDPVAHGQTEFAVQPQDEPSGQGQANRAEQEPNQPAVERGHTVQTTEPAPLAPAPAVPTPTIRGPEPSLIDDENDPTKKVCPAEVGEYPAPYFSDTVLIRLPRGVTEENFIEYTPAFARLSSSVDSVSCVQGVPGATITFMAMTFYLDDKAKDLATLRDETLKALGYPGPKLSAVKRNDETRFYQAVVDVDASNEQPEPRRALFQMRSANGIMYAIVYECHPSAWNALKSTFFESASRISLLAPGF